MTAGGYTYEYPADVVLERAAANQATRDALAAAQDEIERRILECETHRVLVDAVRAERDAERLYYEVLALHLAAQVDEGLRSIDHPLTGAALAVAAAREHRQAVVDSIGDGR